MWGHREKTNIYKTMRVTSEETNPADTLILNFYPLELFKSKCILKATSLGYFVMVAPAPPYSYRAEKVRWSFWFTFSINGTSLSLFDSYRWECQTQMLCGSAFWINSAKYDKHFRAYVHYFLLTSMYIACEVFLCNVLNSGFCKGPLFWWWNQSKLI